MYTEDEARKKWCPHAVASHNDPRRGFHKGQVSDDDCFICIASECMAWRSVMTMDGNKGYCGLAGRPE